jgi:hypothetical protein
MISELSAWRGNQRLLLGYIILCTLYLLELTSSLVGSI